MIVCSCNALSADAVRACAAGGDGCPCTPAAVYRRLGCRARCGRCARTIRAILSQAGEAGGGTCGSCQDRDRRGGQGCRAVAQASSEAWLTQGTLAQVARPSALPAAADRAAILLPAGSASASGPVPDHPALRRPPAGPAGQAAFTQDYGP